MYSSIRAAIVLEALCFEHLAGYMLLLSCSILISTM